MGSQIGPYVLLLEALRREPACADVQSVDVDRSGLPENTSNARHDRSAMTQRPNDTTPRPHPRTLGWVGTPALAMGGSNQSLFLLGPLVARPGSAAAPTP